MELKSRKNVQCLIVIGLLDLRVRGQSDVTGAERRGVFGIYGLFASFKAEKRKVNEVSSFTSVCLSVSQLEFWSVDCRLPSFDLCRRSRNLSFISFFSSDRIRLGFLCFFTAKVTD